MPRAALRSRACWCSRRRSPRALAATRRARRRAQPLTIVAPAAPGGGWDQTARAMQRALPSLDAARDRAGRERARRRRHHRPRPLRQRRARPRRRAARHRPRDGRRHRHQRARSVSLADVTPIARLTGEHEVIVVPADSPHRTLQDLLAALRARAAQRVVGRRLGRRHRRSAGAAASPRPIGVAPARRQLRGVLGRRRGAGGRARRTGHGRRERPRRVRADRSPPDNCARSPSRRRRA